MSKLSNNKLIIIAGPTASGKTASSIKLARQFNGEIINADSRTIYKKLDIGSAKPTKEGKEGIPHHLFDLTDPDQVLTLAEYKKLAVKIIQVIQKNNRLPFLVGGTALYIYAVADNWQIPEVAPDQTFRAKHEAFNLAQLIQKLEATDPEAFKITGSSQRRIIRALEVINQTGKKFSEQRKTGPKLFETLFLGINQTKDKLQKRIETRTKEMLKGGLIEEVENLVQHGYNKNLPALSGIHYKEIIDHLDGKTTLDETVRLINMHDLQLARRQMTWFKKDKRIHWVKDLTQAENEIKIFLT